MIMVLNRPNQRKHSVCGGGWIPARAIDLARCENPLRARGHFLADN
jgi:hypothetical protein